MPKTLVLYAGRSPNLAGLADAIAEGANSVRFAEVDVRRLAAPSPGEKHRELEDVERLADYDAIVLGAPGETAGAEVTEFLARAHAALGANRLADRAGAAFSTGRAEDEIERGLWPILRSMAGSGMLLVPAGTSAQPGSSSNPLGATTSESGGPDAGELAVARQLGKRVATVAAMVAHVRSHHHHH